MLLNKEQKRLFKLLQPIFSNKGEIVDRDAALNARINIQDLRIEKLFKALGHLKEQQEKCRCQKTKK